MAYIWSKFLEGFYSTHVRIRLLHDKAYEHGGLYKKWTDKPYSRYVHRTILISFIISFFIFNTLSTIFPYIFNPVKPQVAQAGSNSITWTTQADFTNNAVVGPDYIKGTADDGTNGSANTLTNVDYATVPGQASLSTSRWLDSINTGISNFGASYRIWNFSSPSSQVAYVKRGSSTNSNYKTTNGGQSWTALAAVPDAAGTEQGSYMDFVSDTLGFQTGYATDCSGTDDCLRVWKTTDGGSSWTTTYSTIVGPNATEVRDVDFLDATTGFAEFLAGGITTLRRSTNGGTSWSSVFAAPGEIQDLDMVSTTLGYVVSTNKLYKTTTGNGFTQVTGAGTSVAFVEANSSIVIIGESTGVVKYSTDGGASWSTAASMGTGTLYALRLSDDNIIWASQGTKINRLSSVNGSWSLVADNAFYTFALGNFPSSDKVLLGSTEGYVYRENYGYQNGTLVGMKVNAANGVARWGSLSWSATVPSGGGIRFRSKGADSEENLAGASWGDYQAVSGSAINSVQSSWLALEIQITTDGTANPALGDFTLTFDTLEAPSNANLSLQKTTGDTLKKSDGTQLGNGVSGGYTNETSLKVVATGLTCGDGTPQNPTCGVAPTNLRPEVQASTASDFSSPITAIAIAGNNYATLSGLADGSSYHLRVRAIDDQGRVSGWTSYGGNESASDIMVEQTAPTGTVTIGGENVTGNFTKSTAVTLSFSGSDAGGSNLSQMRLSNDGNFDTEEWENYATSRAWTLLAGGDGERKVYAQFKDNAGNISGNWLQTSTADFNAGLTKTNVAIANGSITLAASDNTGWIAGRAGTALQGKQVKSTNLGSIYNNWGGRCSGPQCSVGADPSYPAEWALVSPQANPAVDFSSFPIQNACKNVGGRLPFYSELSELYSGKDVYQIYPQSYTYAGATEVYDEDLGQYLVFGMEPSYGGVTTFAKDNNFAVRCVRENPGAYNTSGTYISSVKDFSKSDVNYYEKYGGVQIPSGASVAYQVRAGDDSTPGDGSGNWTDWQTVSLGTILPSVLDGHRYLQYKIEFTSNGSITPTIHDLNFNAVISGAVVTLDTAPPTAFALTSPANNVWSGTEASPTFTWESSSGHSKYELWVDGSKNGGDIAAGTTSAAPAAPLDEGNHTWTVKAYDDAGNVTGASSNRNYGYDATTPGDVTGFTVSDRTQDSITLNWSVASDVGSGVVGYALERKRYDAIDWSGPTYASWDLGAVTTYQDTGLTQGYRYNYRIKAKDAVDQLSADFATVEGFTIDTLAPTDPSGLVATPTASGGAAGFEVALSWNPSVDNGSGLAKYKIWRRAETNDTREVNNAGQDIINTETQVWTLVGVVSGGGPIATTWDDNDANNNATDTDKTSPSPRLNDYTTYHYRVVAVDDAGNHTKIITTDPVTGLPTATNYQSGRTVDVTAPSVPLDVTVTPNGVDSLGGDPLTQAMEITWSASTDSRAGGRTPAGSGSGIKEYEVWQAKGDVGGPTEAYALVATQAGTTLIKEGLAEDSYYYYKIKARDNGLSSGYTQNNESEFSAAESGLTKNSQVPTTPTGVTVTAKTGNPNTDPEVGYKLTVSFTGSKIKGTGNRVDGYRVYRRTANSSVRNDWTSTTPVCNFENLNIPADTQDGTRECTDTLPTDATTYFYKVEAFGWNESNQTTEVSPSLSAIQPASPHLGWDTTPDATAPQQPGSVAVKDIHGNTSMVRNIVTWQMIAEPLRNGSGDFWKYQVYRYETNLGLGTAELIAEKTTLGDNYHVDGIVVAEKDKSYSYYVVALDDAQANFKYANGNIINAQTNISTHEAAVSINPGEAKPTVSNVAHSNIGVSTATITWTTNQEADSLVEYRIKDSATVVAAGKDRTAPVTSHVVNLSNLQKGSTYEYRIVSRNSVGNIDDVAAVTWHEFTTEDFSITGASVVTTTTTAKVIWSTPIAADSSVEYKREATVQAEESATAGDPALVTAHEVVIKALQPDTNYTYKIRSVTGDKYIAETNFLTFRTKPFDASQFVIAPNASNIAEQNITATSAKIVWNTAIATTTWVDYGIESESYNQSAGNDTFNTVHVVELLNLTPGRTYYYRVRGKDVNSIEYTSKEYTFTAVLKPSIQDLKIEVDSPYTAIVTFNTNVDTEAVVTYGKTGSFDLKAGNTEYKRNHAIQIKDLEDGASYNLYIEVKDRIGNVEKSQVSNIATKIDTAGPKVSSMNVELLPIGDSDETASAIISWSTDKPTSTKIEYDEGAIGGKYSKSTIEDNSLSTSHTVIIKELSPGTTYHFRISSKNKRGTLAYSQDFTFVTPVKEKSILQLIIRSLEETFSWVRNVGQFFRGVGQKAK